MLYGKVHYHMNYLLGQSLQWGRLLIVGDTSHFIKLSRKKY